MPLMTWNKELDLGIPSIDDQHKKLVKLLNELFDGMQAGKGRDVLGHVLQGLAAYTASHFRYEEDIFSKTGYPERLGHKHEHEKLIKSVEELQAKHVAVGAGALTIETMHFLKHWLTGHIQGSDRRYAPYLIAKGIK